MPATSPTTEKQQLTVTLPKDVIEIVRSRVSSGEYANEDDFIEAAIVDSILEPIPTQVLHHWIRTEGVRTLNELKANPSSGLTFEQLQASLDESEEEDFQDLPKAG